jgi:hypothetical protein
MSIPGNANTLLLNSAAAGGYQISRSVRFNSADSAYLSRTPASAGNRKTWTWAGWVKRSALGEQHIFDTRKASVGDNNATTVAFIRFTSTDQFEVAGFSFIWYLTSSSVYRDLSAWYHIVVAIDTGNSTAAERLKVWINGEEVTGTRLNPALDQITAINSTQLHQISGRAYDNDRFINGYLADCFLIDGQALDPTSFGEFDDNGIWQPIAYTGTYGTNGFHLDFSDNSAATAATLGADSSGNGNNWTPNNLSVTAGAGNDSLIDSPTNYGTDTGVGGEVRGNYCTLNPLSTVTTAPLSNGNLEYTTATTGQNAIGTIGVTSGSWYWEAVSSAGTTQTRAGVYGTSASSLYSFATNSNVYGFRFNADTGALDYTTDGSTFTSLATGLTSGPYFPYFNNNGTTSKTVRINFGQRPFAYTAPSGFKALCTANLPTGTITTSGAFTGNANTDGPFVYLNGVPTAMTINGNAVTFATHADKLSNGFKVRTSSGSYNTAGSNTYSVSTTGANFKNARAQSNP